MTETGKLVPDANATFRAKLDGETPTERDRPFHCPACAIPYYATPINHDVKPNETLTFKFECDCGYVAGVGLG